MCMKKKLLSRIFNKVDCCYSWDSPVSLLIIIRKMEQASIYVRFWFWHTHTHTPDSLKLINDESFSFFFKFNFAYLISFYNGIKKINLKSELYSKFRQSIYFAWFSKEEMKRLQMIQKKKMKKKKMVLLIVEINKDFHWRQVMSELC